MLHVVIDYTVKKIGILMLLLHKNYKFSTDLFKGVFHLNLPQSGVEIDVELEAKARLIGPVSSLWSQVQKFYIGLYQRIAFSVHCVSPKRQTKIEKIAHENVLMFGLV